MAQTQCETRRRNNFGEFIILHELKFVSGLLHPVILLCSFLSLPGFTRGHCWPVDCMGNVKKLVCGKEHGEIVKLRPDTSLQEALVQCMCLFYVRDIMYPSAFGQLLGFVQVVVRRAGIDEIPWAQKKLRDLLTKPHID